MNYYEHHLGDYIRDTAHLSMLEDGAYRRLMDAYYIKETPLPVALRDVFRLVRAQSKQDREAVETVLREFFTEGPDGWRHSRCDREIGRFRDKSEKAKASIRARWEKAKSGSSSEVRTHNEGNTGVSDEAIRTYNEGNTPRARPQTPVTSNQPSTKGTGVGRASRLPPDWDPGESGYAFAAGKGLTNGAAHDELEKFRDHWAAKPGKDGTALDWQAKWRTWVRNSLQFRKASHPEPDDIFAGAR